MEPVLSIIIPAYNVEKYLAQCLDSIVNQDNGRLEVLLMDDGSTDSTWEICCDYAQRYSFIKTFRGGNRGPSFARNMGIQKSSGRYINFLDSDDYLPDGTICRITERIEKDKPDVILGLYQNLNDATGEISPCGYRFEREKIESLRGEELLGYLMDGRVYDWYSVLVTVRREYLVSHSLFFDTEATFGEDARLVPQILLFASSLSYIDAPVYVYRRNRRGAATSKFSEKNFKSKIGVLSFIKAFSEKNHLSGHITEMMYANMSNLYVSILFDTWLLGREERKRYLQILKPYKFILEKSPRSYHHLIAKVWSVVGITIVSYLLYMRARWVRKKNKI